MKSTFLASAAALGARAVAFARTLPANEPVLLGQAVAGGLTVAATLGLHMTAPQIAGVAAAVQGATAFVLRALVSPAYPIVPPQTGAPPQ